MPSFYIKVYDYMMTKLEILEILMANRSLDTEESIESFSDAVLALYEFPHSELDIPYLYDLIYVFTIPSPIMWLSLE